MTDTSQSEAEQIGLFFDYVLGGNTGYLRIDRKHRSAYSDDPKIAKKAKYNRKMFEWPNERDIAVQFVKDHRSEWEIYFGCALYATLEGGGTGDNVKSSQVVWCEFDGDVPDPNPSKLSTPPPTLRIQSSDGHEHWYWRLGTTLEPDRLREINRAITYNLGADPSGWDTAQVLRPPFTFNHKRSEQVTLVESTQVELAPELFDGLPPMPEVPGIELPVEFPDITEVRNKYTFTEHGEALFRSGGPDRSDRLFELGNICAEMNMLDGEILAVLLNADERWGKFSGRDDQLRWLWDIVEKARAKHPLLLIDTEEWQEEESTGRQMFGWRDIQSRPKSELEHLIGGGILVRRGVTMLAGAAGVGKSTLVMDLMAGLALGLPVLEYDTIQSRVGFFSFEMTEDEVTDFLIKQGETWLPEQLDELNEWLYFDCPAQQIQLAKDQNAKQIAHFIEEYKLDVLVFDSISQLLTESLREDEPVRRLFNVFAQLRQNYGVSIFLIHHPRKPPVGGNRNNDLDDFFGSQFIQSAITTGLTMVDAGGNKKRLKSAKMRHSPLWKYELLLHRDDNLHFTRMKQDVARKDSPASGRSDSQNGQGWGQDGDGKATTADFSGSGGTSGPSVSMDYEGE